MKNNKEKIKAFLSDEKNIKAIANDEEFIRKVSGGRATADTYKEELKKFGLELGDNEAEETKNVVNKIFDRSAKKLDDAALRSISGGENSNSDFLLGAFAVTSLAGITSALGCGIAAAVYHRKGDSKKFDDCMWGLGLSLAAPMALGGALFIK